MKLISYLFLIAMWASGGAALAQDEHVAIFKHITGNVSVIRNKSSIGAMAGMDLLQSDNVVSGPRASCGIVFRDGTRLTLGADSEVEIRQFLFQPKDAKYALSLYLKRGTVVYASGKIGKLSPESVRMNTPRTAIGIRGTRFIVKSDEVEK